MHKNVISSFTNFSHFRNCSATEESKSQRNSTEKRPASGRAHADLVKWQGIPLRAPLLRLPPDLTPLALECFECILRYCGDLPPDPELTEVKCVYSVLMVGFCIQKINSKF